ncbi:MAG: hypothetical protein WBF81_00285, partial [Thermoplasmata archaeon]
MQTKGRWSVAASLVLAATMVLSVGFAVVAAGAALHAGPAAKTAEKENSITANLAAITASMHASMQKGPVQAATHVNSGNWAGYANTAAN